MENERFVDFNQYCGTCRHKEPDGTEEPCNECLSVPARKNSRKPVNWKEREKK